MVILPFDELLSTLHGWVSDVVADIFYIFFDITTKTFDIEELVDKLSVSTVINGDQIYSRFGSAVQFVDFVMPGGASKVNSREGIISDLRNVQDTLFIGYSLWNYNTTEEGCVCMWESGSFPKGVVDNPTTSAAKLYTNPPSPSTIGAF